VYFHKILSVCCQFIHTHNYQFCSGWYILIFSKMALICLRVSIVFHHFKFRVSPSQIAVTASPGMSGCQFTRPKSTGLSGLGQFLSLITGSNRSQKQFRGLKMHLRRFGPPYQRNAVTTLWKTTASDCRHVGRPAVDILNM